MTDELEELIRAQELDDTALQRPQEFGGRRVASLDGMIDGYYQDSEEFADDEPGYAEVEDDLAPEPLQHTDAQRDTVRRVVAGLSQFEQRVYEMTFAGQMSAREIAADMGGSVSYKTVQRAVDRVKSAVAEALTLEEPS